MRKAIIVLLLIVTLLAVPINSYGEVQADAPKIPVETNEAEIFKLTMEDCMNMAIDYLRQPENIDKQMDELWKQQNELIEISNVIQQQLDALERFRQLYEKREEGVLFTVEEQTDFLVYQYMFGQQPPKYNREEMFNSFIKNRDFPHYSVWAAHKNLGVSKEATIASIKMGVKQLYDSIIDLQDALSLQRELYDKMAKQHDQMLVKYENGLVSEINKYMSEAALDKQRFAVQKLERSLDNLKMTLKQQIGIPLDQEIELTLYENSRELKTARVYSKYLEQAVKNRSEILIAKMELDVIQRENSIMREYLTNEFVPDRMASDQALEEKTIVYEEAVNSVSADIFMGHKDVRLKLSDYHISVKKLQNSQRRLEHAKLAYDKGLIRIADLWNAEISNTQERIACNRALRDYNNAVYKLEKACGIGPGYA